MTWIVDASGSQTATIGTEHILDSPTTNAVYEFVVDTINLANGELLELRLYDMVDGTNFRQAWKGTFQGGLTINNAKKSPPMPITTQAKFTLKQTTGTGRVFPWIVRRA